MSKNMIGRVALILLIVVVVCFFLQVNKIQINYARVAKKMDMRKLKSTMWNMLNQV